MKCTIRRREDGQVLVQVALMILVLLLFVGLAVDVGNVYGERRHMQNAADAGALAGAREICFGDPANAVGEAERYAIEENGAQDAEVEIISGYKVRVVAMVAAETYFIRLIPGLETVDVSADATAVCGGADSICNILPIAFDFDTYDREDEDGLFCDEPFFVWVDDNWDVETLVDICEGADPKCFCEPPASAYGGQPMAAGNRGWLRLSEPPPPPPEYPNEGDCGFNCGESLTCWMEWLYSGPIRVGDCVPGKPGVQKPVLDAAEKWEDEPPQYVLLYDGTCDPTMGDCAGDPYLVAGFGCVKVIAVELQLTWEPREGYKQNDCPKNEKVILVEKRCNECVPSSCGTAAGGPIPEGGIGAVSLIE